MGSGGPHAKRDPTAGRARRSIYLEEEAHAAILHLAAAEGRSTNAQICFAIRQHLDREVPGWKDRKRK